VLLRKWVDFDSKVISKLDGKRMEIWTYPKSSITFI